MVKPFWELLYAMLLVRMLLEVLEMAKPFWELLNAMLLVRMLILE